jgi:Rod binding domain-containing protein
MSISDIDNNTKPIQLDSNDANKQKELQQLKKACADFESIFIAKVLSSMRNSLDETSLFGNGFGSDIYSGLFEAKLSEKIAEGGGIGIGQVLFKTLAEKLNASESEEQPVQPISLSNVFKKSQAEKQQTLYGRINTFHEIIQKAAERFKLPLHLIYGVIAQESGGDPEVESKAGAKGLMQLMDQTADELGVEDSFDPEQNILGGACYLRQQLDDFGNNLELALAAYNAGPGSVRKYNGVPPFKETQDYVTKVVSYSRKFSGVLNEEPVEI